MLCIALLRDLLGIFLYALPSTDDRVLDGSPYGHFNIKLMYMLKKWLYYILLLYYLLLVTMSPNLIIVGSFQ